MNEVEIPIKVSGLGAIKAELRALKGEIANATDPADIARLSQAAGALNDRIKDANESVKNFSTGSAFESSRNQIDGISSSLMSLDFAEAGQKMQGFAKNMAGMEPGKMASGLGAMAKGVGALSKQFIMMGASLLTNPIFLIVAVIVAIIVAIVLILAKFGVLQKVIEVLMLPITMLIKGFEMLTDWLGLTSNAADANAERVTAANEKIQKSSSDRASGIEKSFDHEIAMAKQAGKSTTNLELAKSFALQKEAQIRIKGNQKEMKALAYDKSKEGIAAYNKLKDQIKIENDLILAGTRQRQLIQGQALKDANAPVKAAGGGGGDGGKSAAEAAAKARLQASRDFRDYEISQIKDSGLREIAVTNEKYARMFADLVKDKEKTKAEKAKYSAIYLAQQTEELAKLEVDKKAKALASQYDTVKVNGELNDLNISLMKEGDEKELAQVTAKYKKLRDAILANEKLTDDMKVLFKEAYNKLEQAENEKRDADKIAQALKGQTDLFAALQEKDVIAKAALDSKYAKEIEAADGHEATLLLLKEKYEKDSQKMEDDAADDKVSTAQKVRDAKIKLVGDIAKGVTDIGNLLIKDEQKLAKFNKASALVQIGVDTALAISALVAASNTNPANGPTGGIAGIAQFASGIIQIATNMAKAKQLLSSPAASVGGGGGGGSTSTAAAVSTPLVPQLFGSANTGNSFGAGGGDGSMMVTAVVSETEITSTQNKINRINKSAEL